MLAGFASDCWRSPMIQPLIDERFGVFYKVCSSAQLLKPLGCGDPKAALGADHLHEAKCQEWGRHTWPQGLNWAKNTPSALSRRSASGGPRSGAMVSNFRNQTIQISAMIGTVAPSTHVRTAFGSARAMGSLV